MTTNLLAVALILALIAIGFLCRDNRKLRRQNKRDARELGMRRNVYTELREAHSRNARLLKEIVDLRSLPKVSKPQRDFVLVGNQKGGGQ